MYKGPKKRSMITIQRLRILFLDGCFIPRVLKGIFSNYLLLRSGGCTVKKEKGTLNKNGNFSGTTTCSGNSHPFHRTPCPSGYALVRDKTRGHRVYFGDRQFFRRSISGTRRSRSRHYRFQDKQTESRPVRYEISSLIRSTMPTFRRKRRFMRLTG